MSLHRTIFTYLATAVVVGQSSSFTPDYAKAKMAAQKVFKLINFVPFIDNQSEAGAKPVSLTYMCVGIAGERVSRERWVRIMVRIEWFAIPIFFIIHRKNAMAKSI